jgi:enoyl-CoA hydratase/carnithine racemase
MVAFRDDVPKLVEECGVIRLDRKDNIHVLHLGDGDNRFDGDTVAAIHAALDEVEAAATAPAALVTTASGKIWSTGLDLDYLGTVEDAWAFVGRVQSVFARLLRLPLFSVAAIQGHAFAAGAMFALAHDARVMRADRGYFCLPEADLGLPFTDGFAALIAAKVPQPALHRLAVTGERLGATDAVALGVVDAVAPEAEVLNVALSRAAALAPKAKPTIAALRRNFYAPAIDALERTPAG